jgi:hypothetical protein
MRIEEPFFRLWIKPNLSAGQWNEVASALCKIAIDPPRRADELRAVTVRAMLGPLGPYTHHAAISRRAGELARHYAEYLGNGWKRERGLVNLPEPASTERKLLHRIAQLKGGRPLGPRQLLRIAGESAASEILHVT